MFFMSINKLQNIFSRFTADLTILLFTAFERLWTADTSFVQSYWLKFSRPYFRWWKNFRLKCSFPHTSSAHSCLEMLSLTLLETFLSIPSHPVRVFLVRNFRREASGGVGASYWFHPLPNIVANPKIQLALISHLPAAGGVGGVRGAGP